METSEQESIWSRITVNWRGHARQSNTNETERVQSDNTHDQKTALTEATDTLNITALRTECVTLWIHSDTLLCSVTASFSLPWLTSRDVSGRIVNRSSLTLNFQSWCYLRSPKHILPLDYEGRNTTLAALFYRVLNPHNATSLHGGSKIISCTREAVMLQDDTASSRDWMTETLVSTPYLLWTDPV